MTKRVEFTERGIKLPPHIVDDFTRREFLIGAGLIAIVPGCGSGGESDEGVEASSNARIVEHRYGATEVSGAPERVVSVGIREADPMLALGIVPISVTDFYTGFDAYKLPWPWAEEHQGDSEIEVLPEIPINFERIAALQPDLILGTSSGMSRDDYDTLTRIAPTVAQSGDYPDYDTPLEVELRAIACALGRERRARELIADLEARFEAVREEHPEFAEAVAVPMRGPNEGNMEFYSQREIYSRLGFREVPITDEMEATNAFYAISMERLDIIDRDVLIWSFVNPEELREIPLYNQLDAVRQGREIFIEESPLQWALSFESILSLPYALDRMVPKLVAALDGDPETEVPS